MNATTSKEYTIWTADSDPMTHIGFLQDGGEFVCRNCAEDDKITARVYLIHVSPYMQTCHRCKRLVVQGRKGFPELWVRKHYETRYVRVEDNEVFFAEPEEADYLALYRVLPNGMSEHVADFNVTDSEIADKIVNFLNAG